MKRHLLFALLLALPLGGCSLLGDALKIVTPKPGSLGIALHAPGSKVATVVVEGPGVEAHGVEFELQPHGFFGDGAGDGKIGVGLFGAGFIDIFPGHGLDFDISIKDGDGAGCVLHFGFLFDGRDGWSVG